MKTRYKISNGTKELNGIRTLEEVAYELPSFMKESDKVTIERITLHSDEYED